MGRPHFSTTSYEGTGGQEKSNGGGIYGSEYEVLARGESIQVGGGRGWMGKRGRRILELERCANSTKGARKPKKKEESDSVGTGKGERRGGLEGKGGQRLCQLEVFPEREYWKGTFVGIGETVKNIEDTKKQRNAPIGERKGGLLMP